MLENALQMLGIVLLIVIVAVGTLQKKRSQEDGPSLLFAGGELRSGRLYQGAEPNWDFVADIDTMELQLYQPMRSYRVSPLPANGKLYVVAMKMDAVALSFHPNWALLAAAGDGRALIRINGIGYPRRLQRVPPGAALNSVANLVKARYDNPSPLIDMESGKTWVFELLPPGES